MKYSFAVGFVPSTVATAPDGGQHGPLETTASELRMANADPAGGLAPADDPSWQHYLDTALVFDLQQSFDLYLRFPVPAEAVEWFRSCGLGNRFYVLSACNPLGQVLSSEANAPRVHDLLSRLEALGAYAVPLIAGATDGSHVEPSVAAVVDDDTAKALATAFDQSAIFGYSDGVFHLVPVRVNAPAMRLGTPDGTARAGLQLANELVDLLFVYGETNDDAMVPKLMTAYARATVELPRHLRWRIFDEIDLATSARQLNANALMPFLFVERDEHLIATAALKTVEVKGSKDDSLAGAREVLGYVDSTRELGDGRRAAALLAGVLLVGNRDVIEQLQGALRQYSSDERELIAQIISDRPFAPIIDLLVDWLAGCEGREFGAVAARLARLGALAQEQGVVEILRVLPTWTVEGSAPAVRVLERWTAEEYAERIAPSLLEVARLETQPRIIPEVLASWGIQI